MSENIYKAVLFGIAVGDALGVPVEFLDRSVLKTTPVKHMLSYGTHDQPEGTWSDDSSLAFCLAESLCKGYDLHDQAQRFINWYEHQYWTPHGVVFDVGIATSQAISRLIKGIDPVLAGGDRETSNGNGSLMRILPLLFYLQDKPIDARFELVKEVSSLTHRHIRSAIACFIYLEFALALTKGNDKKETFKFSAEITLQFLNAYPGIPVEELFLFNNILPMQTASGEVKAVYELTEDEINSSGYVIHTLEASLWCLLHTDSYRDAVLKAVNLGLDTDTTGAVTGGLAGLYYGYDAIPNDWIKLLARKEDIGELAERLKNTYTHV